MDLKKFAREKIATTQGRVALAAGKSLMSRSRSFGPGSLTRHGPEATHKQILRVGQLASRRPVGNVSTTALKGMGRGIVKHRGAGSPFMKRFSSSLIKTHLT